MLSLHEKIKAIKMIIFDVDGVFTDGKLYFGESGEALRVFDAQDGLGIELLNKLPIITGVISGRDSAITRRRLEQLGIHHITLGASDKVPPYEQLLAKMSIPENQVAYVGDDLLDLPVMKRVGLSITVANANPLISAMADWQTKASGGNGAVREICDAFLHAHHYFENHL